MAQSIVSGYADAFQTSFLAAILIPVAAHPTYAQPLEVSTLQGAETHSAGFSPKDIASDYIVDVAGKKVRLVGPRFYPDNARALQFPGRVSTLDSSAKDLLS